MDCTKGWGLNTIKEDMENTITLTEKELMTVLCKAFMKGENWGITHSGWFVPTEEETVNKMTQECFSILQETITPSNK